MGTDGEIEVKMASIALKIYDYDAILTARGGGGTPL